MKSGAEQIAEERKRQVEVEGYSQEHDDMHYDDEGCELASAAIAYAASASGLDVLVRHYPHRVHQGKSDGADDDTDLSAPVVAFFDPFPAHWHGEYTEAGIDLDKRKKHSRLRQLVIAGALIAAEIDRVQRAEAGLNDGV